MVEISVHHELRDNFVCSFVKVDLRTNVLKIETVDGSNDERFIVDHKRGMHHGLELHEVKDFLRNFEEYEIEENQIDLIIKVIKKNLINF